VGGHKESHTKANEFQFPGMIWVSFLKRIGVGMAAVRPRLVEANGGFWALWGFQSDPLTLLLIAVE